jgi:hypothetical protein
MILIELIFDVASDEQDAVTELARQTTAATQQEQGGAFSIALPPASTARTGSS